jgi:thioredoxin-related protein
LKRYILILFLLVNLNGDNKIDLWSIDLNQSLKKTEDSISNTLPEQKETLKFENDYDIAQKRAKEENKYIFLLVTEKYCSWCKKLKEEVLTEPNIIGILNSSFIPIEVDKINGYYPSNLGIQGTPSIFILNPDNNKSIKSITGYRDQNELLDILNSVKK